MIERTEYLDSRLPCLHRLIFRSRAELNGKDPAEKIRDARCQVEKGNVELYKYTTGCPVRAEIPPIYISVIIYLLQLRMWTLSQ